LVEFVDVSRETLAKIEKIVTLLDDWRQRMNLIGPREMDHIWRRHVLDSLLLAQHIPSNDVTVDLGAGSGFPGLVLAAGLTGQKAEIVMIETVGKKCTFLREAISAAGLKGRVRQGRVENVRNLPAACVTARAFAPLPKLLEYASIWFENGAYGVFPKGRNWQDELTAAQESWTFACDVIPSTSGGDGVILKISEVSRVD
jgi:16S rRNA (guanine527-N7)-methyltransferase